MENRYDKYKDSGIAWIGEIPEHWILKRIKNICDNLDYLREPISAEHRSRNNPIYDYYGASGVIDKIDFYNVDDQVLLIGEDGANLVMRNLPLVYKAKGKFWVNNHAHILKPRNDDYDFCAYAFEAADYSLSITGSAQPKLSQENLGRIMIAIPPLLEQQSIATYLDQKCGEIDELITLQEEIITKLQSYKQSVITEAVTKGLNKNVPLKDSGIEWIGEIPEHWGSRRIKTFSLVKRGASPRPIDDPKYFDENGEFAWVRIADVSASGKYLECTTQKLSKLGSSLSVKRYPGDIFISIAGTVGKPIITNIKCCIHDGFVYFPNMKGISVEYLYYVFLSGQPYLGLGKMGTQLNLNTETIGNIYIPYPNIVEQTKIVYFLCQKCGEIDELISIKQQKIEKLKEYKKSLIFECVTGKRKVC